MNHHEGDFAGVQDAEIYYQGWLPESAPEAAPKGVLLIVHGLGEHSGRYGNVVEHFVPLGYAISALDHVGHGRSEGTRVYVERFSDYVETVDIFVDMVRAWQPEMPIFLVGHSMGALIAAVYLLEHQDKVAAAILSGPAVKVPDTMSPVTLTMARVLSALAPKMGLAQLEAEAISQDPAVVEAYVNDPLVYTGKITARLGAEMFKAMERVTDEAESITAPLLLLQGGKDRLVDPEGAEQLYRRASSEVKTLHVYEDLYHEVYNEPEREAVLADVEAWLEKRLAAHGHMS